MMVQVGFGLVSDKYLRLVSSYTNKHTPDFAILKPLRRMGTPAV